MPMIGEDEELEEDEVLTEAAAAAAALPKRAADNIPGENAEFDVVDGIDGTDLDGIVDVDVGGGGGGEDELLLFCCSLAVELKRCNSL